MLELDPNDAPMSRSPELMSRHDSALLVVDVQAKLIPLIVGQDRLIGNVGRLIDGAKLLGIPVLGTEQYPQGLGSTVPELASRLGPLPTKSTFSCLGCQELQTSLREFRTKGIYKLLVVGIEAHVCVQQTVFDLMHEGFRPYVAVDAVGSRSELDYQTALRRQDSAGATLTTTEAALFEWCETSTVAEFKQLSALVKKISN